ncbi:peptide-methionine (R)-S-oxide reductase MsrB [Candidatus Falkowbacteria bacterium]|nr:peptide-methionine (R)-S-oxide reductase MsrB [Candidatus Falkowbacteria bacterium]
MPLIKKSDKEWKKILTTEQYHILREKGTEPAFSGQYVHTNDKGMYVCAACSEELFSSDTKFASECGWPSFYDAVDKKKIILQPDISHGMNRIEVLCANCGSHLGHVFDDGPEPTGKRYCINSLALNFKKK